MMIFVRHFIGILLTLLLIFPAAATAGDSTFADWLQELRMEAKSAGIKDSTLDAALTGLTPIPRVLELDRKQPEFTQTFWRYLNLRVTDKRVERGRLLLERHGELLAEIEKQYGVQPRFLVAFWGLETNFGEFLGKYPVIGSLATLAYDERRSAFFRKELLIALSILDQGHITVDSMLGSWAGAMGQPQFMPSTFSSFAVDRDGDGRQDIWHSLPDVFASAANFLSQSGWQRDKNWGREVLLPAGFNPAEAGLENTKPLAGWQKMGVRCMDGSDLPEMDIAASLILPAGYTGPAFLAYQNFRTILQWNNSNLYAIAVGHLADRLAGKGPFASPQPLLEVPLARADIIKIQELLAASGFYTGRADGIAGSGTRKAIKKFQLSTSMPADGHPSFELLDRLHATALPATMPENK